MRGLAATIWQIWGSDVRGGKRSDSGSLVSAEFLKVGRQNRRVLPNIAEDWALSVDGRQYREMRYPVLSILEICPAARLSELLGVIRDFLVRVRHFVRVS